MKLTLASYKAIEYACKNFHYAKSVPVNVLGFNVYNDKDEWCGVIAYGSGANPNLGKEFNLEQGKIFELVRVALNGKQEQTSKALSMSLKMIKQHLPLCELIVSYADLDQNHLGILYQATNWYYVGISNENTRDGCWIINNKKIHSRSIGRIVKKYGGLKGLTREQFVKKYLDKNAIEFTAKGKIKYLYPLNKRMRKTCEKIKKNYPKEQCPQKKINIPQ